ncbi:MAG: zonular occludens toxin domain-containing protein [Campylobacterota bacterium]|nr:zonular occludens toxin domain-containing protein [Campylobacterota bacterium]
MCFDFFDGIVAVLGRGGSGKSYCIANLILDQLENRLIITNVKLSIEHPNYVYKNEGEIKQYIAQINFYFQDVKDFPKLIESLKDKDFYKALFIVDEAHFVGFRKKDDGLINWLSVRRHLDQDIYLLTQTKKKIDTFYHPDISRVVEMIAPEKRVHKDLIGWRVYDEMGGDKLGRDKYVRPNQEIFGIYQTGKADGSTNPVVLKAIGLILALIAILVFFYIFFIRGVLGGMTSNDENKSMLPTLKPPPISNNNQDIKEKTKTINKTDCFLNEKIFNNKSDALNLNWLTIEEIPVKSFNSTRKKVYRVIYKDCT